MLSWICRPLHSCKYNKEWRTTLKVVWRIYQVNRNICWKKRSGYWKRRYSLATISVPPWRKQSSRPRCCRKRPRYCRKCQAIRSTHSMLLWPSWLPSMSRRLKSFLINKISSWKLWLTWKWAIKLKSRSSKISQTRTMAQTSQKPTMSKSTFKSSSRKR